MIGPGPIVFVLSCAITDQRYCSTFIACIYLSTQGVLVSQIENMSLCIFVILISYVYSSMSLEYHSCCTIPMDTPLPPLRPQTPRDDSKSSTSRLANSSNVRCSCEMCSRLASELHELRAEFRAKLDGIQQIVTIMNSKLDVYLYPLVCRSCRTWLY